MRRLRAYFSVATIVAFAMWSAGCISPTLPLPPPETPTLEPGVDADHIKLLAACGGAEPSALIVVFNTNATVPGDLAVSGSRATTCGSWDASVYAHKGDVLYLTQEFGTQRSPPTVIQVP